MKRNILVAIAIAIGCATQAVAKPLTISGPSRVVDADTVVVNGIHVRLKGVDAAERGTARGDDATQVMMGIVNGSDLRCILTGEETRRREVGYCVTSNGTDINREIIEMGMALACPRYDTRYVRFEQADALAVQPRAPYCVQRLKKRRTRSRPGGSSTAS
jgi:endonuclease YncB( thermonuclease family)